MTPSEREKVFAMLLEAIASLVIANGGLIEIEAQNGEAGELRGKVVERDGKKLYRFETQKGSRA